MLAWVCPWAMRRDTGAGLPCPPSPPSILGLPLANQPSINPPPALSSPRSVAAIPSHTTTSLPSVPQPPKPLPTNRAALTPQPALPPQNPPTSKDPPKKTAIGKPLPIQPKKKTNKEKKTTNLVLHSLIPPRRRHILRHVGQQCVPSSSNTNPSNPQSSIANPKSQCLSIPQSPLAREGGVKSVGRSVGQLIGSAARSFVRW